MSATYPPALRAMGAFQDYGVADICGERESLLQIE
jgi:hypothetical protein